MTTTLTALEQPTIEQLGTGEQPQATRGGVAGRIQTAAAQAQARVDAARAAEQADWDSRGVLFAGMSRDAAVTLYPDRIERIKQRSLLSFSSARQEVEVAPMRSVSSVQAKKEGTLWRKVTVDASGEQHRFWVLSC